MPSYTNLQVGHRFRSLMPDRVGDAEIIQIIPASPRTGNEIQYVMQTFVWQNEMKLTFRELCEFFQFPPTGPGSVTFHQRLEAPPRFS